MPVTQLTRLLARTIGAAFVLMAASTQNVAAADNARTTPTPAQCEAVNNRSLNAFDGVTLTDAQYVAYLNINRDIASRLLPVYNAGVPTRLNSGMIVSLKTLGTQAENDAKFNAMNTRWTTLARDGASEDDQITALRAEFGKDYSVERPEALVYTPEQLTRGDALNEEFNVRVASTLTPTQRPIFLRNSQDLRTFYVCNMPGDVYLMPMYLGSIQG